VREVRLHPSNLIAPLFVQEGDAPPTPVGSMPGVFRLYIRDLAREAAENAALREALQNLMDAVASYLEYGKLNSSMALRIKTKKAKALLAGKENHAESK
jgi:delta-aminolevulinic acid dehydratase/porphobilinogen synthase